MQATLVSHGNTHVAELDLSNLAQSVDDLPAYLVGDVQLHHAHVHRAEHGILCWRHNGKEPPQADSEKGA